MSGADTATLNENLGYVGALSLGGASLLAIGANTLNDERFRFELRRHDFGRGERSRSWVQPGIEHRCGADRRELVDASGSDTVSVAENLTYGGTFSAGSGTTLSIASGDTLKFPHTATRFAGAINGAGTLALSLAGGSTINAGANIASGQPVDLEWRFSHHRRQCDRQCVDVGSGRNSHHDRRWRHLQHERRRFGHCRHVGGLRNTCLRRQPGAEQRRGTYGRELVDIRAATQ